MSEKIENSSNGAYVTLEWSLMYFNMFFRLLFFKAKHTHSLVLFFRELYKHNDHLEEELKSANIQKTRLAHKNEELQYKLKQYAEAMKQMVNHKNLSEGDIKSSNSIL